MLLSSVNSSLLFSVKDFLNDLQFPLPAPEEDRRNDRQQGKGDGDRPENAVRSEIEAVRQQIGERDLEEPEDKEIQISGRPGVARAVKGGFQNHPQTVENKTVGDNVQGVRPVSQNLRFIGENPDDRL